MCVNEHHMDSDGPLNALYSRRCLLVAKRPLHFQAPLLHAFFVMMGIMGTLECEQRKLLPFC